MWKIVLNEILSIWYEKCCSLCWKTGSLRIYMKEAGKCLLRPVFNWISFPHWLLTRSRNKKEETFILSLISSPLTSHAFKKKKKIFFWYSDFWHFLEKGNHIFMFSRISSPHWLFTRSRKRKTFSRGRGNILKKKHVEKIIMSDIWIFQGKIWSRSS